MAAQRELIVTRLFVYGSLMRGEANHGALSAAVFVGEAWTARRYTLLDLGEYPGLIERARDDGAGARVRGEVYEVTRETLAELDVLEDHPRLFRRGPIALERGLGAEAYFFCRSFEGARVVAAEGGAVDWRRRGGGSV